MNSEVIREMIQKCIDDKAVRNLTHVALLEIAYQLAVLNEWKFGKEATKWLGKEETR